jgi:hypothetical protein
MVQILSKWLLKKPGMVSIFFALIVSFSFLYYWSLIIIPSPCSGLGDCVKYTEMANGFIIGQYNLIDFPFNLRVLTPWFVSLFSNDALIGFKIVNNLSILLFVIFYFNISRLLALRNIEFFIPLLWFFLHPLGFSLYSVVPQSVDPFTFMLMALITLLFISEKRFLLWVTVFFGLLAKESFLFLALVIIFSELVFSIRKDQNQSKKYLGLAIFYIFLIMLAFMIEKLLVTTFLFPQKQPWNITTLDTILYWAKIVIHDPKLIVVWFGAFLCSTGCFSLLLFEMTTLIRTPKEVRLDMFFLFGAAGFILLGLLGGSDMSRIIFNGNLFIMLAFLFAFKNTFISIKKLLLTFIFSLLTLNYTKYFPSTFEYGYYSDHRLTPTIFFIFCTLLAIIFLRFTFLSICRGSVKK